MKFYSTNKQYSDATLKQALLLGLAPDGGLFMPIKMPSFSRKQLSTMHNLSFAEIALMIAKQFTTPEIPEKEIKKIIEEAFNFEIPIKKLENNIYGLELFHGPTLSFKDFGARFMARLISYFVQDALELTILVATSGDTGSAVADGFLDIVEAVIEKKIEVPARLMAYMEKEKHSVLISTKFSEFKEFLL